MDGGTHQAPKDRAGIEPALSPIGLLTAGRDRGYSRRWSVTLTPPSGTGDTVKS